MSNDYTPSDQTLQSEARKLFLALRQVLYNRGLVQPLKSGAVREVAWEEPTLWLPEERAFMFRVDVGRLPVKIQEFAGSKGDDVAHEISSALEGRPVCIVNNRGLAIVIGLDAPEPRQRHRLPRMVELDLSQRPPGEYQIGLGLGRQGPVWIPLRKAGHIMVGGSTDMGKSAWLRSFLYQLMVMPDPVQVLLVDMEGRTFSAFAGLPRVALPVAEDVDAAARVTTWLLDEMERRGRLFDATGYHPEKLEEYHAAVEMGARGERLPRVVAVFDEFTALLKRAGKRATLYRHIEDLSMRSRKYGVTLVYAGQDFKSDLVNSLITHQLRTRIAHACADRYQSENILGKSGGGAERITFQGRAILSLGGRLQEIQGYWVPKPWILALADEQGQTNSDAGYLTAEEMALFSWSLAERDGVLTLENISDRWNISQWQARKRAEVWKARGWMDKDPGAGNAHVLTGAIRELVEREAPAAPAGQDQPEGVCEKDDVPPQTQEPPCGGL